MSVVIYLVALLLMSTGIGMNAGLAFGLLAFGIGLIPLAIVVGVVEALSDGQ